MDYVLGLRWPWSRSSAQTGADNSPVEDPIQHDDLYIVEGRILQRSGQPVSWSWVRVVDVDLRSEEVLGSAASNTDGAYKVTYTEKQFKKAERGAADVRVHVYPSQDSDEPIASSPVTFNAPHKCKIDLVIDGDAVVGPAEFDRLSATIIPLLDGALPDELTSEDIDFLVNETNEPKDRISFFTLAQHAQRTITMKIGADIFYGLFRNGISTDPSVLLTQAPELLTRSLENAMRDNIIRSRNPTEISNILGMLQQVSIAQAQGTADKPTPVAAALSTVLPNPESFIQKLSTFDGNAKGFWEDIAKAPEFEGKIQATQLAVQLGVLTLNQDTVIQKLRERNIQDFSDLTTFNKQQWLNLLQDTGAEIPPEIPGDDTEQRRITYVNAMMNIIEDTYPAKFFTSRIVEAQQSRDELPSMPGQFEMAMFLQKNPKFDFTQMRLTEFVEENPNSVAGIQDETLLKNSLNAAQRIFSIAPRYVQTSTLLTAGFHSALQISRMGQSAFVTQFSGKLGGQYDALQIFENAERTHAMAFTLISRFGWPGSRFGGIPVFTDAAVNPTTAVDVGIPDMATLFGSLDLCACEECRSVEGPAAYLVDVLKYLNERKVIKDFTRDPSDGHIIAPIFRTKKVEGSEVEEPMSVKDALFERRPDIGEIELSCQNTNLPLPYIDLTLEVLENAVTPLKPFKKHPLEVQDSNGAVLDAISILDSAKVTSELRKSFDPPLGEYAIITVNRKGAWWNIDEPAFTYTIRCDENGPVEIVSRNKQTKGTAEERAANPQYLNIDAYNEVAPSIYPWTLPFDLWATTVRTYLAHVDVRRWEIMEAVSSLPTRRDVLQNQDIAHERLEMTPFEAKLVETSSQEPWQLWGFSTETLDADHGIADPADRAKMITEGNWLDVLVGRVDIFLRQANLSYYQLLDMLQLVSVFTDKDVTIGIEAREGAPPDTCELQSLRISGPIDTGIMVEIARFGRLLNKFEGWKVLDLGKTIKALRSRMEKSTWFTDEGYRQLILSLSHVLRLREHLPEVDVDVLLTLVSKEVDTAPYKPYEDEDEDVDTTSFYARTFRNKTVVDRPDKIFTADPNTLSGNMSDQVPAIAAATNMGAMDLIKIIDAVVGKDVLLTLENLSIVFRHSILAQALSLTASDYLLLLKLYPVRDVFVGPLETLLFLERTSNLLALRFTLSELAYLLLHASSAENSIGPDDETVALLLSDLRLGLQKINVEYTFTDAVVDLKGDITQKMLAAAGWNTAIIAQAISAFNGTSVWSVLLPGQLSAASLLNVPGDIREKLSYEALDNGTYQLSFVGVMKTAEQTKLREILGSTQAIKDAIDALFQAPRTFFQRNMQTISVRSFEQRIPEGLPSGVKIPPSMSQKIYFDDVSKTLYVTGAMSESDRDTLLAGTDETADKAYRDAVSALYNAPITTAADRDEDDIFLTQQDVSALFDAGTGPAGDPNTPLRRFTQALQKLMPRLKRLVGQQYVTQKLSDFLGLDVSLVQSLLDNWLTINNQPVRELLQSDSLVQSNASGITRRNLLGQFNAITRLSKVATLAKQFKLSKVQFAWLFDFRKRTDDPAKQWLDLNSLPVEPAATADFEGFERLAALIKLRDRLPAGEQSLDAIFRLARKDDDGSVPDRMQELWADISSRTTWPIQEITTLASSNGLNIVTVQALQDEVALSRIQSALALLLKAGCSATDAIRYAKPVQTEEEARSIVLTIKSKYDLAQWQTIASPLRNILRDEQRKALVSYMLVHCPLDVQPVWRNANDLYAYYLTDVEMGPCQMTSRIKQAISVTQLFVQRCLMNLEPGVKASAEYDDRWDEWKTLKSFRITSAGRQVFQRPENFLESSYRDDKTDFFRDLEADLKQEDLTAEVAEKAFTTYVEKLDAVANLEVAGFYHQLEYDLTGHVAIDNIHVFARTRATPSVYYYRRLIDRFTWTSWEHVPGDIAGSHLIPVVWRRRIHLFWAVITEKQQKSSITMPSGDNPLPVGDSYWEIKLAWTEKKRGKWLAKTVSDDFILCWKSGRSGIFDEPPTKKAPGRTQLTFKAYTSGNSPSLRIECLQNATSPHVIGYFLFDGARGNPKAIISEVDEPWRSTMGDVYTMTPKNTIIRNMYFTQSPVRDAEGILVSDDKVWLYTRDFSSSPLDQTLQILSKNTAQTAVLGNTEGEYSILPSHQDVQFSCQRPFFFIYGNRSFFVEPSDLIYWIRPPVTLGVNDRINPALLDGSLWKRYIEKPAVPGFNRPYPNPGVVGIGPSRPTFELGGGLTSLSSPINRLRLATRSTDALFTAPVLGSSLTLIKPEIARSLIDLSRLDIPIHIPQPIKTKHFKFSAFYHPFVPDFIWNLNRDGIDGLLQRPVQMSKVEFFASYLPNAANVSESEYPTDDVDFDNGPMSIYNWELFFHIPLMIAESLSKNQQFAESQKWFHYIFDPTDLSVLPSPQKFWRTKPFFEMERPDYAQEVIGNLMRFLAKSKDPEAYSNLSTDDQKRLQQLEDSVRRWRKDPFNPFLIARYRPTAFQRAVVMKYLDNLIAWGDNLFRMDTLESINEATQLFMLASNILGDRPAETPPRAVPRMQTYNSLEPLLDDFSNALVRMEELVPLVPPSGTEVSVSTSNSKEAATSTMLFFCIPKNDKLLAYWDTVTDRLFKIRNCMNLQGVIRELALFEPAIDPNALIKAASMGVDLGSVLNDINATLPYYRFTFTLGKALELCNELKSLGQAMLSALEKKDAEQLSLIRSTHEQKALSAARLIRERNIQDATSSLEAVTAGKAVVSERYNHYSTIPFLNAWEITQISMEGLAFALSIIEAATQPVTAALALIPEIKVGAPTSIGVTFGGQNLSYSASYFGAFLQRSSALLSKGASMAATMASYNRRADEWALQARLALNELAQFDKQIAGASVRLSISEQELKNHDLQVSQHDEIDDYMRNKFNNVDLYDWTLSQLSTTYFQSYKMAFDIAKTAERAYAYELGLTTLPDMIQFGYWDSLKKGLLAGERLLYSLKSMELSYTANDKREYEIMRSISVLQLDPVALMQLKELGSCVVNIPEALFDLDYPGHYFRRIKSISVTIPCIVGPYTSISCKLMLLKSSIRTLPGLSNGVYKRATSVSDRRFTDSYAMTQDSIALSTAQNDSGLFETNLRDERYLPFERAGAISSWSLQLAPPAIAQIDTNTIQDVVIHMRYTAREAGEPMLSQTVTELRQTALDAIRLADAQSGLARMFSVRHEFADAWYQLFIQSGAAESRAQTATIPLIHPDRFPLLFRPAKSLTFTRIEVFIRIKDAFRNDSYSATTFKFYILEDSPSASPPTESLSFSEFGGCLRGSKTFAGSGVKPGNYRITVALGGGELVSREAVEDIMLVVFYKVNWS